MSWERCSQLDQLGGEDGRITQRAWIKPAFSFPCFGACWCLAWLGAEPEQLLLHCTGHSKAQEHRGESRAMDSSAPTAEFDLDHDIHRKGTVNPCWWCWECSHHSRNELWALLPCVFAEGWRGSRLTPSFPNNGLWSEGKQKELFLHFLNENHSICSLLSMGCVREAGLHAQQMGGDANWLYNPCDLIKIDDFLLTGFSQLMQSSSSKPQQLPSWINFERMVFKLWNT